MIVAIIGGIWLSLLYSATVLPASVRVIQMTVSRSVLGAGIVSIGLALGQVPWCLLATAIFFNNSHWWIALDLPLRVTAVLFLLWMAYRTAKAGDVVYLKIQSQESPGQLLRTSFWRSLVMPWRLPFWIAIILSVGIHLRGPGLMMAGIFTIGALIGQFLWFSYFILIAWLFGKRVPEEISLRSMNKLRFLATIVLGGLALIILAPIAFPPS